MSIKGRRIALLINDMRLGGAERQCLLLAEYLLSREAHPVMVVFGEDGDLDQRAEQIGVPLIRERLLYPWSLVYSPFYLRRVAKCLRKLQPDVVMGFTSIPNMYGALTAKKAGASRFIWNQRDDGLARPHHFWEQRAVDCTDAFIANSPAGSGFLKQKLGVADDRISVIRNGVVVPEVLSNSFRRSAGIPKDAFVAAMVGNLRPPKDPETLFKAWALLKERCRAEGQPCPHLLLIGRIDDEAGPVSEMIRKAGLGEVVHVTGFREDVQSLLSDCNAGVFSSLSEGLPNAVLEMMGQGLPVVATDIPGVRACGDGGGSLRLTPAGDAAAMADQVMTLYSDSKAAQAEGAVNARFIREHYHVDVMGRETANVLWPGSGA